MWFTAEEIVRSYKNATNKHEQITILADLNDVRRSEIKRVLTDAGVELLVSDGGTLRKRRDAVLWSKEEEDKLIEMYLDFATFSEIQEATGKTKSQVGNKVRVLQRKGVLYVRGRADRAKQKSVS
ncbi:MAG: hypothetical protein ACOYI4_03780 [Christensenellales bacterium]